MFLNPQHEYSPTTSVVKIQGKPRVLIIDDNFEFLEELEDMLSLSGCQVKTLSDSGRALDVIHEMKPQIILLDLKMGPKSGFQVADEVRSISDIKDIPIIAMTGFFSKKEHVLMMKLCGIKTFILKPFSPDSIIAKMEFALGLRREEYGGQESEEKDQEENK